MKEKMVSGILVREVRPNVWVSEQADVWMENVGVPSKSRRITVDRWHKTNATRSRVLINNELRYRLVAEAWVHNPDPKQLTIINHIDGDPRHDWASNLEWCNHSHNGQHAYDMGLNSSKGQTNENLRLLSDSEEQDIHKAYLASKAKNRLNAISEEYDISRSLLKKINRKWR